jgi:ATP-binding cassette subfamily A (ABC1) protein 3
MAEGQLRCAGSSLFLKKHYGVGYQLTIEKKPKSNMIADKNGDSPATTDDTLQDIVKDAVPEATMLSNVGTELSFQLPIGAASKFTPMFEKLDEEVDEQHIVTYGVSITTLDEVFLLVARGGTGEKVELQSSRAQGGALGEDDDKSYKSSMDLENDGLFVRHVQSLFRKRALNFKRDKKAWFCSTMLPSLLVLIGFIIFKFISPERNMESLELTINTFNADVKGQPRNPIPFNAPGSEFTCQPGVCMVWFNGTIADTDDSYTFCGVGLNGNIESTCSISESANVMDQITQSGADGIPLSSSDVLESSKNVAESSLSYAASQFGALQFTHDQLSETKQQNYTSLVVQSCADFVEAFQPSYFDAAYCESYGGVGYVVNYNFTALHASLVYQALADEALMQEALNDDQVTISATVHPLPLTDTEESLGQAEDAFSAWFLVVLSFPFIAGTFATFVVTEKASKAKHLQTVAGVQPSAYWISSYLWDVMNYQLPLWIVVILMFAFGIEAFTTSERGVVGGVIISLILYGPAAAGFTYCVSFLFISPSMCNLFIIIVNFFVGLAGPLVALILRLIGDPGGLNNTSLITAANTIEWILRFIPSFNLGSALFKCINIVSLETIAKEPITVWHESALLYEVIFQGVWCFAYLGLAIQIDKWSTNPKIVGFWQSFLRFLSCRWLCSNVKTKDSTIEFAIADDEDVIAENERVAAGEANTDLIVLDQLTKVYDNGKVAVNNLSLGIPPGQCFGLLGKYLQVTCVPIVSKLPES